MNKTRTAAKLFGLIAFSIVAFLLINDAYALEIELVPASAQRAVGGKVRVHIYANPATALMSMGIKVSFNDQVLDVEAASKYEDFDEGWVMDADGDPATTDDQYKLPLVETNGNAVTMIGGRLMGPGGEAMDPGNSALEGKVLLGWIDFVAVGNGTSNLHVDLGRYNPGEGIYHNFVNLDKSVDEPTNVPGNLGVIHVAEDACECDLTGDGSCNGLDWLKFYPDWNRDDCKVPGQEPCLCDLNNDGNCNGFDWLLFYPDWNRTDCLQ
jgi:hypothetical protein